MGGWWSRGRSRGLRRLGREWSRGWLSLIGKKWRLGRVVMENFKEILSLIIMKGIIGFRLETILGIGMKLLGYLVKDLLRRLWSAEIICVRKNLYMQSKSQGILKWTINSLIKRHSISNILCRKIHMINII